MQTWECKYEGRAWSNEHTAKVAAMNFQDAIKKVKRVARREQNGKRIRIFATSSTSCSPSNRKSVLGRPVRPALLQSAAGTHADTPGNLGADVRLSAPTPDEALPRRREIFGEV
jgi:hypothetical protein